VNYDKYYNLETYLFDEVGPRFRKEGIIHPLDFYFILTWKANRSKNKAKERLKGIADGSFKSSVHRISRALSSSTSSVEKLRLLMKDWGFRLPTATAILTVLYPDEFTVYDVRVCNSLKAFHRLESRRFTEKLWGDYLNFKAAVERAGPKNLSLRNKDRYLWGKSLYEQSSTDIG